MNNIVNNFSFKEPYIYRDEDNKKWCVRYSIKHKGQKNYTPLKEYGKHYLFGKTLNSIKDLKEREKEAQKVLRRVFADLEKGVDIKQPETVKAIYDADIKEAKKLSYDVNFELYLKLKGYVNPIPKKTVSAGALKTFHKNQLRPFLEKKGFLDDLNKINKSDMLEFMNYYYLNDDPKLKWSNNTFNSKKGYISSFFQCLVDEEIMDINPVTRIKFKPKDSTERFEKFTTEERDLIFDYLDKHKNAFIATIARIIYYAFIRESEVTRLKVSDFDVVKRRIRIEADNAKGQTDKKVRYVRMTPQLTEAIQKYLDTYPHQPDWFMFAKKWQPSPENIGNHWQYLFFDSLQDLRKQHPDKFLKSGLSLYSLKHSGITDLFLENPNNYSIPKLLHHIQLQARHKRLDQTLEYMRALDLEVEDLDEI